MSAPLSSSWRTPAIPVSGVNPAASSASEPSSTSVSGLRNSSQGASQVAAARLHAWAKPRFSLAIARACGKSRSTSSRAAPVAPLSTTTRSSDSPCACSSSVERQRGSQRSWSCETTITARSCTARTVASGRGRDSALPRRARGGADARRRARAGRAAAAPAVASFEAAPVGEGLRDEGCSRPSSAAAPASSARRARCACTSARAGTSSRAG